MRTTRTGFSLLSSAASLPISKMPPGTNIIRESVWVINGSGEGVGGKVGSGVADGVGAS